MDAWPEFDSAFLGQTTALLKRRRKSIKNSVRDYTCERVRERFDDQDVEKLEMTFRTYGPGALRIRLDAWEDRWLWLWVAIEGLGQSGWRFEWRHEGRVGAAGPHGVSDALRQTLQFPFRTEDAADKRFLDALWHEVAIAGPRGVVC